MQIRREEEYPRWRRHLASLRRRTSRYNCFSTTTVYGNGAINSDESSYMGSEYSRRRLRLRPLLFYLFHLLICNDAEDRLERMWEKKEAESERKERSPPKVIVRERALTIRDGPDSSELDTRIGLLRKKQKTLNQNQSPLMRLPAEIRSLIWAACIGEKDTYVLFTEKRFRSFHRKGEARQILSRPGEPIDSVLLNVKKRDRENRENVYILPLLQTCRAIYSEAIDMVYQKTTFTFCDVLSFIAFQSSIMPSRLNQIRSIYLNFDALSPSGIVHEYELETVVCFSNTSYTTVDLPAERICLAMGYTFLWASKIQTYNELPTLEYPYGSTWGMCCSLIKSMESLQNLKIVCSEKRINITAGDFFHPLQEFYQMNLKTLDISVEKGLPEPEIPRFTGTRKFAAVPDPRPRSARNVMHPLPDTPTFGVVPPDSLWNVPVKARWCDGEIVWSAIPDDSIQERKFEVVSDQIC